MGEIGSRGEAGVKGEQGLNGQYGLPGHKGESGGPGARGDRGFGGNNGQKGDKGMAGVQGPPGTATTAVTTATTQLPTAQAMTTQPPTVPSERCGGPGWRKVVLTNTSHNCPQGLKMTGYSKPSCGRTHTNDQDCSSVITFPVGGGQYNRVCGRVKAYHWGIVHSFYGYNHDSYVQKPVGAI